VPKEIVVLIAHAGHRLGEIVRLGGGLSGQNLCRLLLATFASATKLLPICGN